MLGRLARSHRFVQWPQSEEQEPELDTLADLDIGKLLVALGIGILCTGTLTCNFSGSQASRTYLRLQ